jgi:hypothetical protein
MKFSTVASLGGRALLAAVVVAGCAMDVDQPSGSDREMFPGSAGDGAMPDDGEASEFDEVETTEQPDDAEPDAPDSQVTSSCALGAPGVYSPFAEPGGHPSGPVDEHPWTGIGSNGALNVYPAGDEDFRGYGSALPKLVECSNDKDRRSHLDVTTGCLDAVAVGSYSRGRVRASSRDYFRALALGYTPNDSVHPVKWTDQGVEYRFLHHGRTGSGGNPGFKAFARYRSENDLYVASWRFDGVVQIQRKLCGQYTALAVIDDFGPPSANVWHRIAFEADGHELRLYLDDDLVLSATSSSLSWGTAGIRIDSADGTYIDDWIVYQP